MLYKRISLELSHTWPGQMFLRFESKNGGPAVMVEVHPEDITEIARLNEVALPMAAKALDKDLQDLRRYVGPWPDQPGPRRDRS